MYLRIHAILNSVHLIVKYQPSILNYNKKARKSGYKIWPQQVCVKPMNHEKAF